MIDAAAIRWLPVVGFPSYEVSSVGQVRRALPGGGAVIGRILRGALNGNGYLQVNLSEHGVVRMRKIHQLVAEAFIGPRGIGIDTCHNNGIRTDNRAENLRYDTRSGNFADRERHGRPFYGEGATSSILTEANVLAIRSMSAEGYGNTELGRIFGVHRRTISDAVRGETWAYLIEKEEVVV